MARATPAQTAREIGGPLPALRDYRPDLPGQLASCIDACLDPEPERRPSLVELRRELERGLPALTTTPGPCPTGHRSTRSAQHAWAAPGRPAPRALRLGARGDRDLGSLGRPGTGSRPRRAERAGDPGRLHACHGPPSPRSRPCSAPCPRRRSTRPSPALRGRRRTRACSGRSAGGACWRRPARWTSDPAWVSSTRRRRGWSRATAPRPPAACWRRCSTRRRCSAPPCSRCRGAARGRPARPHVALALLGALLWAAGSRPRCGRVADGGLAGRPVLLAAAAAVAAVIVEFRRRAPRPGARLGADPGLRLPIPRRRRRPGHGDLGPLSAGRHRPTPTVLRRRPLRIVTPRSAVGAHSPCSPAATPEELPDQRSAKPGAADREPRRGGVQPRLLVAGSAGRDRPQAGEGDGRPPNRLGVPRLRAEPVHGLALGRGSTSGWRAMSARSEQELSGLPARARAAPRLRAPDPPQGRPRDRRAPAPRRVRDPDPPGEAAGPPGRGALAGGAGPHDGLHRAAEAVAQGAPPARKGALSGTKAIVTLDDRRYVLDGPVAVLGRSRECDCVLSDPNVSRRHAELRRGSTGDWQIVDLGSTNGIKVNDRRVDRSRLVARRRGHPRDDQVHLRHRAIARRWTPSRSR